MSWFRSKSNKPKQWRNGVVGAVSSILLGLFFLISGLGSGLRNLSFDLPFKFKWLPEGNDAVIIYMDEQSAAAHGQTYKDAWNRGLHASLIKRLKELGAKAIVWDLLWTTNGRPEFDQALATSMREHGKVVVASDWSDVRVSVLEGGHEVPPIETIRPVCKYGVAKLPIDTDLAIRQHSGDKYYTALAWRAAEAVDRAPPNRLAKRWLNFYGPGKSIPHFSYIDVLPPPSSNALASSVSTPVTLGALSNKVVFVGAESTTTGGGTSSDEWPTPFTRYGEKPMPGVEFQATAFLNLINKEWLTELSPLTEFGLCLAFGALFGFGLVLPKPWIAAGIAVGSALAISGASMFMVWNYHLWAPFLVLSVVQIPVALGWAVLANTRNVYQEKEQLEQTLATARAASASASAGSNTGSGPAAALKAINQAAAAGSDAEAPTMVVQDRSGNLEHQMIGDHELIRSIGKGAYGEVWLGKSLVGIYHAVKVVYRRNFEHAAPFEREFRGLKKFAPVSMSYPGFVQILHVGKNDAEGYFYYTMELGDDELSGQDLNPETYSAKNLGKELKKRGSLHVSECLSIGIELAGALDRLHQKDLIHRDIKPSNIIFVHGMPKLADIGLVTTINANDVTFVGTPGYIPKEGPGTQLADIFGLGKVLYECVMGRDCNAYPELPSSLLERQDQDQLLQLNKIISKACDPDPCCRYASAGELRTELLELQKRFAPTVQPLG